jgi:membrane protein implicated in regulation of membrane protease activity
MKNPVLAYFLLRIALFAVALAILLVLFPADQWLLAAIFAAVISFALSILLLRKQRDAMSAHIYERSQRRRNGGAPAEAKDVENDLLDGKE